MRTLNCKQCGTLLFEGKLEGRLRNDLVCLCTRCWRKAEIAIEMAELARTQTRGADMPEFLRDIFDKKG
jgi:phage FluMu protein Com